MCEIVNNLLQLIKPFIKDIEKDYDNLKEQEQNVDNISDIIEAINGDSINTLNIEDKKILEFIDKYGSNKLEYEANKYILQTSIDGVKTLPQYLNAKKYIDVFYEYLLSQSIRLEQEYQQIKQEYQDKELLKKYYDIFNSDSVFINDLDELIKVFDILKISIVDKNNLLIYILKENRQLYSLNISNDVFSDNDKEKVLTIIDYNKNLDSKEYDELLEAVSDYVDITKNIYDIIDDKLIDKINISNILLAKKVWLFRKIKFAYYNMNCHKCKNIVEIFEEISELYDRVRDIKSQEEVIRMIKGDS